LIADDTTKFNIIPNITITNQQRFTKVYRDSYISGFLKGSKFNALLSIKLNNIESAINIKGALLLKRPLPFQIKSRTHAILTKYSALQSYQLLLNKGSPLDYKNIGIYINALLESYLDYKGKSILTVSITTKDTTTEIKSIKEEFKQDLFSHIPDTPYNSSLVRLVKAKRDCRLQMIRIVKEVFTLLIDADTDAVVLTLQVNAVT
ncbi:uncharacterized protein N7484_005309, partial [Penicillium longicatenatum]|uniref:uncharacterized protein n=1 Tax=Penicillium longicatenatum TaxID=1561947 RepID=UPI002547CD65